MRGALAGLVAIALLAGCGPGAAQQANRYVDSVNRAQSRFARTMDRLSGRIGASSAPGADLRVLRAFDSAVTTVVADLRTIKPPGDVAPLHQRLIGEINTYGRNLHAENDVLRSGDSRALVAAQQRLLTATRRVSDQINTTIAAINKRLKST